MGRCEDCIHDGCCDGLPRCGGVYFQSRWVICECCGDTVTVDDCEVMDNGDVVCNECIESGAYCDE